MRNEVQVPERILLPEPMTITPHYWEQLGKTVRQTDRLETNLSSLMSFNAMWLAKHDRGWWLRAMLREGATLADENLSYLRELARPSLPFGQHLYGRRLTRRLSRERIVSILRQQIVTLLQLSEPDRKGLIAATFIRPFRGSVEEDWAEICGETHLYMKF